MLVSLDPPTPAPPSDVPPAPTSTSSSTPTTTTTTMSYTSSTFTCTSTASSSSRVPPRRTDWQETTSPESLDYIWSPPPTPVTTLFLEPVWYTLTPPPRPPVDPLSRQTEVVDVYVQKPEVEQEQELLDGEMKEQEPDVERVQEAFDGDMKEQEPDVEREQAFDGDMKEQEPDVEREQAFDGDMKVQEDIGLVPVLLNEDIQEPEVEREQETFDGDMQDPDVEREQEAFDGVMQEPDVEREQEAFDGDTQEQEPFNGSAQEPEANNTESVRESASEGRESTTLEAESSPSLSQPPVIVSSQTGRKNKVKSPRSVKATQTGWEHSAQAGPSVPASQKPTHRGGPPLTLRPYHTLIPLDADASIKMLPTDPRTVFTDAPSRFSSEGDSGILAGFRQQAELKTVRTFEFTRPALVTFVVEEAILPDGTIYRTKKAHVVEEM